MASLQSKMWLIAGRGLGSGEDDECYYIGQNGELGQAKLGSVLSLPIKWVCARIFSGGRCKLDLSPPTPVLSPLFSMLIHTLYTSTSCRQVTHCVEDGFVCHNSLLFALQPGFKRISGLSLTDVFASSCCNGHCFFLQQSIMTSPRRHVSSKSQLENPLQT
jgi:hypothetical protein